MSTYQEFLRSKLAAPVADGFDAEPTSAGFPWQRAVVQWAWRRGRAALFEDCGLGKTLQWLEWAHGVVRKTNKPVLALAPLGVTYQTVEEGEKFNLPVQRVADGGAVTRAGVYVTNYQRLHRFSPEIFGGVVLDESSILKDIGGATRRIVTEAFARTPYRLSCTATPSPNDLSELGNQAEFLGICTGAEMLARFFINDQKNDGYKWRLKGHARQAFYDWLATWAVYLRSPAAIGFDAAGYSLPEHRETLHEVAHDHHHDGLLFKVDARSLSELRATRKNSIGERLARLAQLVDGEAAVTWCSLNAESDALAAAFPEAVEIAGRHAPEYKEEMLLAFAHGEISHLVTKPSIAGHGMNFQRCCQQHFFGLDHSFERYYQASRRLWRFGQTRPVSTHIILEDVACHVWRTVKDKEAVAAAMAEELEARMKSAMQREIQQHSVAVPDVTHDVQRGDGWEFHLGDAVDVIRTVPDRSVGYQVMSPPFPEVYTYSDLPQDMGNTSHEDFSQHFAFLASEMLRVAQPGRLATLHCMDLPVLKRKAGYIGLWDFPGELIRVMEAAGWRYFARRMVWKDPVIENARTHSLGHGNLLKDSTKSRAGLCDYLLTFQAPGDNPRPVEHDRELFPVEQWQLWASPSWTSKELTRSERQDVFNPPDWMLAPVWYDIAPGDTLQKESAREEADEKHICPLQLTVIRRCIVMWSAPGDLVASWYGGIGSEGFVAIKEGRRALLVELKRSYWEQGCRNLVAAESFKTQLSLPGV